MADVWTCCQCKTANLIANSPERCPVCPHTRCTDCQTGRPTFSHIYTAPYHPHFYPVNHSFYHYSTPTQPSTTASASRTTPRYYTTTYPSSPSSSYPSISTPANSAYPSASSMYTAARPSMSGWWVCCSCKQSYNPALVPERCPLDEHKRCDRCVLLR